ncbi:MAG: protein kinase domain-containing protein [Flammeovirgaceae bacterium]
MCKIADLGLAKILENDLANTFAGTRGLMAPEIFQKEGYGHKADVWSIGCLFYQLLFGFLPFQGAS